MDADPLPRADSEPPAAPPSSDVEPLLVGRAINFCTRCGAKFADDWLECMRCASRATPQPAASAGATDEPPENDIRPVKSAMGLYFSLLTISLAMTIYSLAARDEDDGVTAEIVATVLFSLVTLGWVLPFRRALAPLLTRIGPWWIYLAAPVLGTATFIVASFIVGSLNKLVNLPDLNYTDSYNLAGYGFGFAILMIAVQPAVIEELAFRGVMTSALDRVLTLREASIVVSLLFGILHLSVPSLAHLTLLGLLLAWLRRRAGSLYPCMLMHFTHNLLVLLDERYGWLPW